MTQHDPQRLRTGRTLKTWIRSVLTSGGVVLLCFRTVSADLPDLAPVALQMPNPVVGLPYPNVTVISAVTNQGSAEATGYWYDSLYLSTQPVFDGSASSLYANQEYRLAPGSAQWTTNTLQLPITQSGQYYLLLKSDAYGWITESDETNNVLAVPFTFQATPADLATLALQVPSAVTGPPYPAVTVSWAVTNQGPGAALGYWHDAVWLSTNSVLDGTAQSLASVSESSPMAVGDTYWNSNTWRLPMVQSGTYYLFVTADDGNTLYEANTDNNTQVATVVFNSRPPDLAPVALQPPASVTAPPYPAVTVVWGVTNQGTGEAFGNSSWPDQLYISANMSGEGTRLQNWWESGPVPPGGSYWRTNSVELPVVQSGTYYLIFKTDSDNRLYESDPNNNSITVPITLNITPSDLVPVAFKVPTVLNGPPYPAVTLVWGATNQGIGAALSHWFDRLYVSANPVLDFTATDLGWRDHSGPVLPGESYRQTNTVRLPLVESGAYYLFLQTDIYDDVYESDESNNLLTVPITFNVQPPDLSPVALLAPNSVTAPPYPAVTVVWGVTNQGTGEALGNGFWEDQLYLSTNMSAEGGTYLTCPSESGPVLPGGSYWRTNSVQLPVVQSGTYYLVFSADADNSLRESDTNNNTVVVPITINITPADLAPVVFQAPNVIDGPPYPQVTLVWGATNQGIGAALGNWYDQLLLSTNSVVDSSAVEVQQNYRAGPLSPAGTYLETNIVRLPVTRSGNYYLFFQSDADDDVYESNESNNLLAVPVTFNAHPPDLVPVALQAPATLTAPRYPTINVVWGVTNQGAGEARSYCNRDCYWYDALYLSSSNSPDGGTPLQTQNETGPVPAAGSYWRTNSVQLPVTQSGVYYLVFKTDINDNLLEADTNNNVMIVPITLTITPPDLAPVVFQGPSVVTAPPLPSVTFSWGVVNQGSGPAIGSPYWTDVILISTNSVLDSSARQVSYFYEYGPIAPGTVYWRTNDVSVPITRSGTYYFFFEADSEDSIYESNMSNNVAVAQVTFNIRLADLTPSAFTMPSLISGPPNPKLLFSWGITNAGAGAALGQWSDQVYLSIHSNLDQTASSLLTSYEGGPVPPGGGYKRTQSATVPVTQDGQYYFILQADVGNSLYESNTANNIVITPVTFQINPPDLAPVLLLAPGVVAGSIYPNVTLTYGVTNQGAGPAMGTDYPTTWSDQLFVSRNPVLDGSEILVGPYYDESGPVAPAHTYWRTRTVQVPVMASGSYYFLFRANAQNTLFESNFTNNVTAVPVTFNFQLPDLAPIALVSPSVVKGPPSPGITLAWGITNRGSGQVPDQPSWAEGIYLSTDTNLDWPGTLIESFPENGPMPAGGWYWRTNFLTLPVVQSGTYYLVLKADDPDALLESDENNNVVVVPVTFQLSLPDLAPLALQAPAVLGNPANQFVTLVTGVTNQGPGSIEIFPQGWDDSIYISRNPFWDGTAMYVSSSYETGPVAAGGSYWRTNTVWLPLLETGDYFLIFSVNSSQGLPEATFTNNTLAKPFSFRLVPPDLAPIALQAPSGVDDSANPLVTLIWGVTNLGPGQAGGVGWADMFILSTNSDRSGAIAYVLGWYETNSVPAGGSYWQTNTVRLPVTADGTYYLLLETDIGNYLGESDVSNNVISVPVTFHVRLPDLAAVTLQAPPAVEGPPNPVLSLVWGVTNQGGGTARPLYGYGWYDTIYLSTDSTLDASAIMVWGQLETNSIPPGGGYWRTNEVQMPVGQSGAYYLLFVANAGHWPSEESDYANNTLAVPVAFTIRPPDLAPVAWLVPETLSGSPWPTVTVVVGVTNRGSGSVPGHPGWTDGIYLSTTPFLDQDSYPFATLPRTNTLAPGSIYWVTNTLQLPVLDSATWYLIFKADAFDSVGESDEENNSASAAISFELSPPPNLVPIELDVPPVVIGSADPTVTLAWHVANQGLGALAGRWSDAVFLSSRPGLDWMAQPVLTALITNTLLPGADYWQTNSITVHGLSNGTYYFILKANYNNGLFETDLDDNTLSVPVRFDVTVPSAPVIAGGEFLANGSFQLAVYGSIGSQYVLQASTNLFDWVAVCNFTVVAAPTYVADPQAKAFQRRFYRVATVQAPALPPLLTITRTATNAVIISWPLPADGWVLERTPSLLGKPASWTEVSPPFQTNSTQAWITVAPPQGSFFYRLRSP